MIELVANRKAMAVLAGLSTGGRMPHALLLEGPEGCGKKTLAALVAQLWLCTAEQKPCGVCPHCSKVEKGIHPDVRVYSVPDGKREFPVELVRALRQDAYIKPNEGQYKVYLLDQAHRMNTAAQNALLKIIEEPPAQVRFVLLCENRSLMLETIRSRVTCIALELPDAEQCVQALGRLAPDASDAERQAAAAGADGNIGQALALLGSAKPSKAAADTRSLMEALICGERYRCIQILAGYEKNREGLLSLFSLLEQAMARLAADRYRKDASQDDRYANRVTPMQAVEMAQAVSRAAQRARQNAGVSLLCAALVEEMKGCLQ